MKVYKNILHCSMNMTLEGFLNLKVLVAHYLSPTVWSYDLGMIDICLYYRIIKDNLRAIDINILSKFKDIWYQEITGVLIKQTACMIQVGQAKWDDIKILKKAMGHLISNFWDVWDSKPSNINIIFVF